MAKKLRLQLNIFNNVYIIFTVVAVILANFYF